MKQLISMKVDKAMLEIIDAAAKQVGEDRTEFMVTAAYLRAQEEGTSGARPGKSPRPPQRPRGGTTKRRELPEIQRAIERGQLRRGLSKAEQAAARYDKVPA